MVDGVVEISRAKVLAQLSTLRASVDGIADGRGHNLKPVILLMLARVDTIVEGLNGDVTLANQLPVGSADRRPLFDVTAQRYQRLLPQLGVIHMLVAEYRGSIGRADVPVGIQHLVDLLIEQVVPMAGDPIIHSNTTNMYSTIDLVALTNDLLNRAGEPAPITFDGPRPIVFNLPALDPANALLSPVLAHEVAHTAVNETLLTQLLAQTADRNVAALFETAVQELGWTTEQQTDADALVQQYHGWCSELLSDAVALVLTGPSFLFAFGAFAPPSSLPSVTTHPSERDRARFHLYLLDHLGWTPFLEQHAPQLTSWFRDISSSPVLANTPQERFLRGALASIEDLAATMAIDHVGSAAMSPEVAPSFEEHVHWVGEGVPMVEYDGTLLDPWQVVLAGWVSALRSHGDAPASLPAAVGEAPFNALIVKMLEHSSVTSAWRDYERTAA